MPVVHVVVLAGGVGGARFLSGLRAAVGPADRITAIINTGDDLTLHGLRVCPDLDTVMYTLGGRHRRRAWLGPREGDMDGQGRARCVRR